ncbi:MAG: hypothetical protein ABIK31_03805 [candidate division WOR-3 bacterium]
MKHIKIILLSLIVYSLGYACNITITANKNSAVIGDTIKLTINVKNQHLNCPLSLDSTKINITNASVINQEPWQKKSIIEYEKSIAIKINNTPEVIIEVSRLCHIKESKTTFTIAVTKPIQPQLTNKDTVAKILNSTKTQTQQLLNSFNKLKSYRNELEQLSKNNLTLNLKPIITNLDSILKFNQPIVETCSLLLKKL